MLRREMTYPLELDVMKNFLKLPKNLSRRYRMAKLIQRFDLKADGLANPTASSMPAGVYKSTIDEVLECYGLAERMRNSELRQLPADGKRAYFSWELPNFLWSALLGSEKLKKKVTDYLGPDARIDDLYVKTVLDGYDSTSEGWHDDNVGYRLKVFMVFDIEGIPSGTVVVPTARPNVYRVRLIDELARMIKRPKTENRPRQEVVKYDAGDCLIFDTNIPHRGDYSTGKGIRYCVIAEFIDRNKANALRGRAPCGPGQGRRKITIPPEVAADFLSHPLVDKSLVHNIGDSIYYGYD